MPAKPKILFIMPAFQMGGAEKQWAQYLSVPPRDTPVEIEVMTFMPKTSEAVYQSFRKLDITLTHIDRKSMSLPRFLWEVFKFIRKTRPVLVNTVLQGSTSSWGRLMAYLARVPVIMHSDRASILFDLGIHSRLRPFLDRITDGFTPNSFAIGEQLSELGISPDKIHVVPNVTDVNGAFNPKRQTGSMREKWGIPENVVVAGFIAAFREEKRIDVLLDAILLTDKAARPDFLVMGGDGDKMEFVKSRVASDPWLSKHCLLIGRVKATPAFYAGIDYLLLTSDYEGTPNVVLEAQSMEKPVVSTDVADIRMMLEDSGIIAERGNPASVARGIEKIQSLSENERTQMGKQGREKVVKRFELHNAASEFWKPHLELIKKASNPG